MTRRLFLGCLLAPVLASAEQPRVNFLRPPRIVNDQFGLWWDIQVDPRPENRLLVLSAHDGEFTIRRSDVQLEGERQRRTNRIEWRTPLPAGELMILASVWSQSKELARVTHALSVVGWP